MADALRVSTAPVIFSHSGARGVTDVVRNVPDDILKQVRTNGGVVMVNFYSSYLIPDCDSRNATLQDVVGGESTTGTPSYRHQHYHTHHKHNHQNYHASWSCIPLP